ncbi:hypothetical protein V6N12_026437 [Hibiscus sabdariffa]|uniref:Fe2OG dioxygenase domain-containing protein n=1 Tax=Hibiscus sabdariffa TaxID=183260 RepID=A0ABR2DRS6_9ROSI
MFGTPRDISDENWSIRFIILCWLIWKRRCSFVLASEVRRMEDILTSGDRVADRLAAKGRWLSNEPTVFLTAPDDVINLVEDDKVLSNLVRLPLGLSKVPGLYVQPPNERIDKENAIKLELPPIDLSKLDGPGHHEVAEQIVRAAETVGFFQVVNHGVPLHLIQSLKDTAHKFFGLPLERKAVYLAPVSPSPLVTYGTSYLPEKEKALGWKDYILMQYTGDDEALRYWPDEINGVLLEYMKSSIVMVKRLLRVLLENIGVKSDDSMIDVLIGKKMVAMIFYPICPNPDVTIGIGRHSDIGMLTVLLQDEVGGLYVKVEKDMDYEKKAEWIEIPPIPDALVINVADMLQVLSNGKYRSAEHAVRNTNINSRVSVPIFTMPIETAKIAPLPQVVEKDGIANYREFPFGDYMNNVFTNALDGKKSLDFAKIS